MFLFHRRSSEQELGLKFGPHLRQFPDAHGLRCGTLEIEGTPKDYETFENLARHKDLTKLLTILRIRKQSSFFEEGCILPEFGCAVRGHRALFVTMTAKFKPLTFNDPSNNGKTITKHYIEQYDASCKNLSGSKSILKGMDLSTISGVKEFASVYFAFIKYHQVHPSKNKLVPINISTSETFLSDVSEKSSLVESPLQELEKNYEGNGHYFPGSSSLRETKKGKFKIPKRMKKVTFNLPNIPSTPSPIGHIYL